jgi:hypothetical protein
VQIIIISKLSFLYRRTIEPIISLSGFLGGLDNLGDAVFFSDLGDRLKLDCLSELALMLCTGWHKLGVSHLVA